VNQVGLTDRGQVQHERRRVRLRGAGQVVREVAGHVALPVRRGLLDRGLDQVDVEEQVVRRDGLAVRPLVAALQRDRHRLVAVGVNRRVGDAHRRVDLGHDAVHRPVQRPPHLPDEAEVVADRVLSAGHYREDPVRGEAGRDPPGDRARLPLAAASAGTDPIPPGAVVAPLAVLPDELLLLLLQAASAVMLATAMAIPPIALLRNLIIGPPSSRRSRLSSVLGSSACRPSEVVSPVIRCAPSPGTGSQYPRTDYGPFPGTSVPTHREPAGELPVL
jgi:hypothetical protein